LTCIVPKRDVYLTDIIGYNRLELYLKIYTPKQGRLSPSNIGAIPPQPKEVLREGQGVVLPVSPTRSPNEVFVDYTRASAVIIVALLVNYFLH